MTLVELTQFFQWNAIIGITIFTFTAIMSIFARDFMYGIHKNWFELSREAYNIAIYAYLGVFKIMLILFVLVPYSALLVIS